MQEPQLAAQLASQEAPVSVQGFQELGGVASESRPFIRYNKRIIYKDTIEYEIFREQKNKFQKKWRRKNPDKFKFYIKKSWITNREGRNRSHQKYVSANKEKVKAKADEWRAANRERINAERREYRANPELYRAKRRLARAMERLAAVKSYTDWIQRTPKPSKFSTSKDYTRAYSQKHYLANKPVYQARNRARQYKKKAATIKSDLPAISKWEVRWRTSSEVTCFWCLGKFNPKDCETEHMVAIILGGLHAMQNLCISCKYCNDYKSGKSLSQWNKLIQHPILQLGNNFI